MADQVKLPPPLAEGERAWDLLRACAILPWAILLGISFGFWFVVFLLGSAWLAEGLRYPQADTVPFAGESPIAVAIAVSLMIALTYCTMALRRPIVRFLLAVAEWLFIRLYPREREVIGDTPIQ